MGNTGYGKRNISKQDVEGVKPYSTRLVPHPVPQVDLCDAPFRCLRVNSEWASHIVGALQSLLETDAWIGTPDEVYAAQQAIERACDMLSIPCPNDADTLLIQSSYESTVGQLQGGYDGTPSSVDPGAPDDAFDQDANDTPEQAACRPNSLCAVVTIFVKQLVAAELKRRQGETTLLGLSAYVVSALNTLGWITGPAAPAILIGGALLGLMGAAFAALDNAMLTDALAIDEVICCILSNLYGKANTPASLASACDPCDCFTQANSEFIAGAVCPVLAHPDIWYLFQSLLADAQLGCANGLLDVCGCDEWCAVWDFSVDNGNWGQSVIGGADYVAGQYWNRHDYSQIGQASERRCWIRRGFSSHAITFLEVVYDYTLGHQEPPDIAPDQSLYINLDADLHKPFGTLVQGTSRVISWRGCVTASEIDIRLTSSKDFTAPQTFSGDCRIRKVTMKGRGTYPFEAQYLCP